MFKRIIKIALIIIAIIILGISLYFAYNLLKHPERKYLELPTVKTVHIPLDTDQMVALSVPKDAKLLATDGITLFVYGTQDGTLWKVTKTFNTNYQGDNTIKGSAVDDTSVTHNYGKYSVIVQNDKYYLKNTVNDFTKDIIVPTYYLVSENKAPSLPSTVSANDAKLSSIGIYNPPTYEESIILSITANITTDGDQFFTAYQQMGDVNEIIRKQLSWLAAMDPKYNPDKVKWYQDDKTWFAVSGSYYVGARYASANNWTLYYCSKEYSDYLVKNLSALHPAK